jgi:DNA-binding transcriptional ArsR family regulator
MPTVLPEEFKKLEFFKSLPVGVALIGDKETGRAFVGSIRPRLSQHEGREAVAEIEKPVFVDKMAVWSEAREAILSKLRETPGGRASIQELSAVIQKLGEARGVEVPLDSLLADLRSDELLDFDGEEAWIPQEGRELPPKPEVRPEPKGRIIQAIPFSISQDAIRRIAEGECRRRYMLFGDRENPASFRRMYYPLVSMMVDYYPPKGKSMNLRLYLDGLTREILLERQGGVSRSHGLRALAELKPGVREVFAQLGKKGWMNLEELCRRTKLSRTKVTAAVQGLETGGLLEVREDKGYREVRSKIYFKDLPEKLSDKRILRVAKLPAPAEVQVGEDDLVLSQSFGMGEAQRAIGYWDGAEVVESKLIYYPHWRVVFADVRGPRRVLVYDGLSGKREKYVEEMVKERSG